MQPQTSSAPVPPFPPLPEVSPQKLRLVVWASVAGTVFEWYDFFLFGTLAGVLAKNFFTQLGETAGFIFALLVFATGLIVRPFGAIVFGRLGDMWGRKNTFLITVLLMGGATCSVGLLPSYASIGLAAPALLTLLRMVQGLALGGEYGGAAVYVSEHATPRNRGLLTSFIQATSLLGLLLSLAVVSLSRELVGPEAFDAWGWRIPFLCSIILLAVSVLIRLKLHESPVFKMMETTGTVSKRPLAQAFGDRRNRRLMLAALFGLVAGQAVVAYTGQFYPMFFLDHILKLDSGTVNKLVAISLVASAPFFIFFGWLSDRIGRKRIIIAGCALSALCTIPLFHVLTAAVNPALVAANAASPVTVQADSATCSIQFDPLGMATPSTGCDLAKSYLVKRGIEYDLRGGPVGRPATIGIGERQVAVGDAPDGNWQASAAHLMAQSGYPSRADPAQVHTGLAIAVMTMLMALAAMVYGPMAAALVELFPPQIRFSSISFPFHMGNGWIGGLMPTIAFALTAANGSIYFGLWYPVVIAALSAFVGIFCFGINRVTKISE